MSFGGASVGDSTRSPHVAVATLFNELLWRFVAPEMRRAGDDVRIGELLVDDASPEDRVLYTKAVNGGWLVLATACLGSMVALGLLAHALGGHDAAVPVVTVGLGVGFYCAAGVAGALWHKHFAVQARRRSQREGPDNPRVRASLARTLPGRGVTLLQVVVGVLAAVVAAATL